MSAQGDIVFMIGADVTGLTSAGNMGERSLADMEKAAKALERQLGKIGEAGAAFQRDLNQLAGVTTAFGKSARDSAAAFEAFDRSRAQVDNLRASIDPLFAASKRYEAALMQLDAALEMGTISAREHSQMLEMLSASYLRADGAASSMGGGVGFLGNMTDGARSKIQQVGFQVQDFAVQVGAGTSATQAFAQQFPQLAGAFGPVGVAVGTLAAIGIPLLAAAFANASAESDKLAAAADRQKLMMDALSEATARLRLEREMASSGAQLEEEQQALNEITRLTEERAEVQARLNSLVEIGGRATAYADQAKAAKEALQAELDRIDAQLESLNLERARTAAAQAGNAVATQMQAIMGRISVMDLSQPWAVLPGFIQAAIDKAAEFARASMTYSGRGQDPRLFGANPGQSNTFGVENYTPPDETGSSGSSGGGGTNPMQGRIEALVQTLKTETEITAEWYASSLEALNAASEAELAAIGGKHEAIERLEQEHQERLSGIRDAGNQWGVQAALDGGAAILGALVSTNKKAQKAQSIFAAASAFMSTYQGAAKELEKGTFGFASAAAVITKGIGFVTAIKRAGGSSSSGSSSAASSGAGGGAAAPAAQQNAGTHMNFQFTGGWASQEAMGRFMVDSINEAVKNGATIKGSRYT